MARNVASSMLSWATGARRPSAAGQGEHVAAAARGELLPPGQRREVDARDEQRHADDGGRDRERVREQQPAAAPTSASTGSPPRRRRPRRGPPRATRPGGEDGEPDGVVPRGQEGQRAQGEGDGPGQGGRLGADVRQRSGDEEVQDARR
jgi:hypothetical protein